MATRWKEAQELFDQLVELPTEEQARALANACPDDPELRRMVEGLLAADAENAPDPAPAIVTLTRLSDAELPAGTRVGAYRIERLLGSGGMGKVYLGSRADGRVEQQVAIKTIRGSIAGRDLLQRFERERRILAKLNHPNIAHFVDAGEAADGAPFFAMEYVAGTPLLLYAEQQRLDLGGRLRLFVKIAAAVDHAHRQLVVHRDLKPGNVLIDSTGEPKLLDFGVAKSIQQQREEMLLSGQTAPESRYLSLRYAAPEQISGDAEGVSIDIYALGGMLYELLTGQSALNLDRLSLAEARVLIAQKMPQPPSAVAAASLPYTAQMLRGDLDRIVLHALKKEPEQRYASAAALRDDLVRVLEFRPISLRASHRWYLLARFLRRHRLSTSMAAALALLTVGAAVVYREQRDIALQASARAEAINTILVGAFESADPSRNKGDRLSARDVLRQARHVVAMRTDLDGSALTALLLSLSDVHNSIGLFDDARLLAEQALSSARDDRERLSANYRLANALFSDGQAEAAKQLLPTLRGYALTQTDPQWGTRLDLLEIDIESFLGSVDAMPLAAAAYARAKELLGPHAPLTEAAASVYANRLIGRDSTNLRGAEFVREMIGGSDLDAPTAERMELLKMAARAERELGNYAASVDYARRHLQLADRLYGQEHGVYVAAESLYARALGLTGDTEQSRTLYSSSVERAQRVYGTDSAILALVAHNAGDAALRDPVDLSRALAMSAIAVDVGPRAMPAESRQMGFLWLTRALALSLSDQHNAALDAANRASAIFHANLEQSTSMYAEAELLAAVAEHRLARADGAQRRIQALGTAIHQIQPDSRALTLARVHFDIPGDNP